MRISDWSSDVCSSDLATTKPPFDQRLARMAMRPIAQTPVTPNMVTGFGLVGGLTAGWLLAQGGAAAQWGAGAFVVAVWLDHADGELARRSEEHTSELQSLMRPSDAGVCWTKNKDSVKLLDKQNNAPTVC